MDFLIPSWENLKFFRKDLEFIVDELICIADPAFQSRIWVYGRGPEVDTYAECMISFDEDIDYLKDLLRKKKMTLSMDQIKAILRVYVMGLRFERMMRSGDLTLPDEWTASYLALIQHPYWRKIQQQAQRALALLRA